MTRLARFDIISVFLENCLATLPFWRDLTAEYILVIHLLYYCPDPILSYGECGQKKKRCNLKMTVVVFKINISAVRKILTFLTSCHNLFNVLFLSYLQTCILYRMWTYMKWTIYRTTRGIRYWPNDMGTIMKIVNMCTCITLHVS